MNRSIQGTIAAALLLLTPSLAQADCLDDGDCKGDRVCVRGECLDPEEVGRSCRSDYDCDGELVCRGGLCSDPDGDDWAGSRRAMSKDQERATERVGDSIRRQVFGWLFLGVGSATGLGGGPLMAAGDNGSVGALVLSTGHLTVTTIGTLSAQAAGPKARDGIEALGYTPTWYPELRAPAWALYITSGMLDFIHIGFLTALRRDSSGAAMGGAITTLVVGVTSGVVSTILFEIDGIRALAELRAAREGLYEAAAPRRHSPSLAIAPWAHPEGGGSAGLAAVGRW